MTTDCPECRAFTEEMTAIIGRTYDVPTSKSAAQVELANRWLAHDKLKHIQKPRHRYAFTFTTNGNNVMSEQGDLCYAAHKLFHQNSCPIREGGAWLEYTESGRPHIHGWYETEDGGRVFSKVFQRSWHLWKEKRGLKEFPGGYHAEIKSDRYLGYASAEGRQYISKKANERPVVNSEVETMRPESGILFIET